MPYMVTFTINIPQMLPYLAYMDPMANYKGLVTGHFFTLDPGSLKTFELYISKDW